MPRKPAAINYCGCCGRPAAGLWCQACWAHIGWRGTLEERTYYALHGQDCPYQVKPPKKERDNGKLRRRS